MKAKLRTPEALKNGNGQAVMKKLLLSIAATTLSIALTFGTAAIIENNKKQKEKREIVMMVMFDMYNSLKSVEKADSMIRQSMDIQLQIARDTTKYEQMKFQLAFLMPAIKFTETTEHIFSSSIETINTVGNVVFTENVAEFYLTRKHYKVMVCDSMFNEISRDLPLTNLKGCLAFPFFDYALLSSSFMMNMQHLYTLCKQMMNVTDEEIDVYKKERKRVEDNMQKENASWDSVKNEIIELQNGIDEAKKRQNLE